MGHSVCTYLKIRYISIMGEFAHVKPQLILFYFFPIFDQIISSDCFLKDASLPNNFVISISSFI